MLTFTTPEGYGYGLAAVGAGTNRHPFSDSKEPAAGSTYAYADYVLSTTGQRPVLLDYPADLFMPIADVPDAARQRCMPQPGVPADKCTLPNHTRLLARLGNSRAPYKDGADTMIPAGASYLVRVATDLPVDEDMSADKLKLYVWDARFSNDRKGVEITFP
jgi:hypothetical protein